MEFENFRDKRNSDKKKTLVVSILLIPQTIV